MTARERTAGADAPTGIADALYPFLSPAAADPESLVADVRRSTIVKAREIAALRERLREELGVPLAACARALARSFAGGGQLLTFGNGGSATDAQAAAALFLRPPSGRALPALALPSDDATITALANDVGFEVVYARLVAAYGGPGDAALGLSTSGNSENVIRGLVEARRRGLVTIALAGYAGGRMAEAGVIDHLLVVPSTSVHRIQEAQTTLYHVIWELTQATLVEAGRSAT
jgi:D-sedoheptulose 7-phosphate isomerase